MQKGLAKTALGRCLEEEDEELPHLQSASSEKEGEQN